MSSLDINNRDRTSFSSIRVKKTFTVFFDTFNVSETGFGPGLGLTSGPR